MNIGDIVNLKPTIDTTCGFACPAVMPCRVIYIHPQRRFCTVEFQNGGYAWRESFYLRRVSESDTADGVERPGRCGPQFFRRKKL